MAFHERISNLPITHIADPEVPVGGALPSPDGITTSEVNTRPFEGQIMVYGGGTRGIAPDFIKQFGEMGGTVITAFVRNRKPADRLGQELSELGISHRIIQADLMTTEGRASLLSAANELQTDREPQERKIDYLVLNIAGHDTATNVTVHEDMLEDAADILADGATVTFAALS